nr:hypothetical protein [Tanacetum cinerariifolium]
MQHDNNDELHETLATSRKRRHDDQDPPLSPPKDSDRSKKKNSSKQNLASPSVQPVNDNTIPEDMHLSESKDTGAAHLPKIKTRPDWLNPVAEEDTSETPEPDWVIPLNDLHEIKNKWIGKLKFVKVDLEGQAHKNNISLQFHIEECHLLLTDQIDLMNLKEADFKNLHSSDFEDLYLPNLQGKLKHLSGADKVYLSTTVNLWTRNIVIIQRIEDLQLGIESYQTKLNLTQPRWDATNFLFKEDYTIVHKPRVVIYKGRINQNKMMRETEVHKFSDGTLTRILEN